MSDTPPRGILHCGVRFEFVCDRSWLDMEARDPSTPHKRFCDACHKDVYWCINVAEAALRVEQGECIAVPAEIARRWREQPHPTTILVGRGLAPQDRLEQLYLDIAGALLDEAP